MSIFYSIASRGWIANQIKGLAAIKEGSNKIWVFDGEMQCSKANKGKVAWASGKNLIADERRGSKDQVIAHDRVIGADITLRRPGEKSCRGLARMNVDKSNDSRFKKFAHFRISVIRVHQ